MEVFNTRRLNQNQRFLTGVIVGILSALILGVAVGIAQGFIGNAVNLTFPIITWAGAYGVAYMIQKFGRGVQLRFSVLGALCSLLLVIVSDVSTFAYSVNSFSLLFNPMIYGLVVRSYFSLDIQSLISVAFRGIAVYIGFENSRFL